MALTTDRVTQLVLAQLGRGEMRLLSLTVSVRRSLGRNESVKGDLGQAVKSALRTLVAAKQVMEDDGMFLLAPTK